MKRLIGILFIFSIFSAIAASAEQLPVLKVYFPGTKLNNTEYIQGNMVLEYTDGSVTELPAKFKTRGATALQYTMKPSFNMKLEDAEGNEIDSLLLDLRRASSFILDAMAIDRICMRNRVCFDIWNSFSLLPYPTDFDSRNGTVGKFVIVYMNDDYKGIYCLSDKINRKLLDLKKPKVSDDGEVTYRGLLYKQGTNDIEDQNTPGFFNDYMVYVAAYHDAWELHEPDDYHSAEVWDPLVEYYQNLGDMSYITDNFFMDNLVDYSLFVMALSISDNWGNKNKYFSMVNWQGKGDERRFVVTPWDLDTSLGGSYNGSFYDGNYSDWTPQQIAASCISPFSVCFATTAGKDALRQRWIETRETVFSVQSVSQRMLNYCNLFEESGAWSQYVEFWNSQPERPEYVDNLSREIDLIIDWYAKRFETLDEYFNVTSGIDSLYEESECVTGNDIIYNLQGMPVPKDKLVRGTIYVTRGKKFLWK